MHDDPEFFGIRAAARRVHRSRRTIHRWMNDGLRVQTVDGRRQVSRDDLLAMWRLKMRRERAHQFQKKTNLEDSCKKISRTT